MSGLTPSMEADEAGLVSGILVDGRTISEAVGYVQPEMIVETRLRRLYGAAVSLFAMDQEVTPSAVLKRAGDTEEMADIVEELIQAGVPGRVAYFAKAVRDAHQVRQVRQVLTRVLGSASSGMSAPELVEMAMGGLIGSAEHPEGSMRPVSGDVSPIIKEIERRQQLGGKIIGFETGIQALDTFLQGIKAPDFYIIAARPSVGKTSLLMNILRRVLLRYDGRILLYTLESSREQVVQKLIALAASVPYDALIRGSLSKEQWPAVIRAASEIEQYGHRLIVEDSGDVNPMRILVDLKRETARGGVVLVAVDYIQLMKSGMRTENRTQEVSEISRGLKLMGLRFKIPVIALSQLNRAIEHRADQIPILSDLRESGSLEQDADEVIFLQRDVTAVDPLDSQRVGIRVAKHRNGPVGTSLDRVKFIRETGRFANILPAPGGE